MRSIQSSQLSDISIYVGVIGIFIFCGIQYMRMAEPRVLWKWKVTPHLRLGPALFVLLAAATAYLGYWEPKKLDSQFGPDVDSRIGFIVVGFSPFVLGTAMWAVFAYVRLWRIQFQSPSVAGWIFLVVLAVPLAGAFYTGAIVLLPAIDVLPEFVKSFNPFDWFG